MLVADFFVIVRKGIPVGITRRIDRHSNSGRPELPRNCGSKKVTEAGKFGSRLPLVLGTCRAVKVVDGNLVGLRDLDLDLGRRTCPQELNPTVTKGNNRWRGCRRSHDSAQHGTGEREHVHPNCRRASAVPISTESKKFQHSTQGRVQPLRGRCRALWAYRRMNDGYGFAHGVGESQGSLGLQPYVPPPKILCERCAHCLLPQILCISLLVNSVKARTMCLRPI